MVHIVYQLPQGNQKGGLRHILDGNGKTHGHASDFQNAFGVSRQSVPGYIKTVATKGKLVSSKTIFAGGGRLGYERVYYYNGGYHLLVGIDANGFIVTAFASKKGKFL